MQFIEQANKKPPENYISAEISGTETTFLVQTFIKAKEREKKGSKWLYAIRALKKRRLTDRQLVLVYCSIIRSVLIEYASPAWAGLTQYLGDQIESIQKRALKIIFPSLCYEDALKKSGLILLCQRREDACITFLKRSYSSSDLPRSLVPRVANTRPYTLRTGESVFVAASARTYRFGNFCTIKYQNLV